MVENKLTISKEQAKESKEAVADLLLPEPLCPYYRGKADAFREVLGFVKALKSDE